MNEKGLGPILVVLIALLAIVLLAPVFLSLSPSAMLLFKLLMILIIYSTVNRYLQNKTLSLAVAAVLIYLLVLKHPLLTASAGMVYLLISTMFVSAIVWGVGGFIKPKKR